MTLDANSFVVRLLVAVLLYFFFNIVIDTLVKDERPKEIFKIILLFICIAIVFIGGFLIRF